MNDVNQNNAAAGIDLGGSKEVGKQQEQRVLTPLGQREDWPREVADDQPLRRIVVVDCETTDLDWVRHKTIEIRTCNGFAPVTYFTMSLWPPM